MNRFKNILLVLNPEGNDDATVSLAVSLARRNQSNLTLISMWKISLPRRTCGSMRYPAKDCSKG